MIIFIIIIIIIIIKVIINQTIININENPYNSEGVFQVAIIASCGLAVRLARRLASHCHVHSVHTRIALLMERNLLMVSACIHGEPQPCYFE